MVVVHKVVLGSNSCSRRTRMQDIRESVIRNSPPFFPNSYGNLASMIIEQQLHLAGPTMVVEQVIAVLNIPINLLIWRIARYCHPNNCLSCVDLLLLSYSLMQNSQQKNEQASVELLNEIRLN